MADLIGCKDVVLAAQMAAELGADELCLHMPKRYSPETQALWERALTDVREARSSVAVPLYVAGGITPADVPLLLDSGADGLIVGGAITGAPDPAQASHQFRSHACRG
jgi:3-keto-L-gulonate-6-phosphate decarboxylase